MKRPSAPGTRTSPDVEIIALTPHALWIWVRGRELMLDYARFPWFRGASIADVERCELSFEHLHWPHLDIDLHLDSLTDPERFPLLSKVSVRGSTARAARRPKATPHR